MERERVGGEAELTEVQMISAASNIVSKGVTVKKK